MEVKKFNEFLGESKRQKISLNGYDMWLDKEKSVIFDSENSKHGLHFDVLGEGDNVYIGSHILSDSEKEELLKYIKNG
jgi:hypothetical protein